MSIHYLQITDEDSLTPLHRKCMGSVKSHMRSEDTYEIIIIPSSKSIRDTIKLVDTIKLTKASEIPNLCIVDRDCLLLHGLHELNLVEGKPYFAQYEFNDRTICPDIYLFYVNGRCDYFKNNLTIDSFSKDGYSLQMESLKNLQNYLFIDPSLYLHLYETMSGLVNLQKIKDLELELYYSNLELSSFRKSVEQMAITMKMMENIRMKHEAIHG